MFIVAVLFASVAAHAAIRGGTVIGTRALAEYLPAGSIRPEKVQSNLTLLEVQRVEALRVMGDAYTSRPPLVSTTFNFGLTNTGNDRTAYRLSLADAGGSCPAPLGFSLAAATVHIDRNNSGTVDADEPALSPTEWVQVEAGSSLPLLVRATMPGLADVQGCMTLSASSQEQGVTGQTSTVVALGAFPAVEVSKQALLEGGHVLPGSSRIRYHIGLQNMGVAPAVAVDAVKGVPIWVDGQPRTLLLVRDSIPAGARYLPGTLQTSMPGALRLFRYDSDAQMAFRTLEDGAAVEVAIGLLAPVPVQGSVAMDFAVQLKPAEAGSLLSSIVNQAQVAYGDGSRSVEVGSNLVVTPFSRDSVGIALAAGTSQPQATAEGQPDGTAIIPMTVRVRNYADSALFDVQIRQVLEGASPTYQLGTYTPAAVPGPGQYTVVPGSLRVQGLTGSLTSVAVAPGFTGQASADRMLAAGARLGPQGEFSLTYDIRVNFQGRDQILYTSARVEAARETQGSLDVTDDSVNGSDPDPLGLGPQSAKSYTPLMAPPALGITKTASLPRRLGGGVYEIDYTITVSNSGTVPAREVRVVDNLACAFGSDALQSWSLVTGPSVEGGRLQVSAGFTGKPASGSQPCDAVADPRTGVPTDTSLSITDGLRDLQPGQSETLRFTVRATLRSGAQPGTGFAEVANLAWVAATSGNPGELALVAARAAVARSLLIDPQGVVYDSQSRNPLAGAVVTVKRQSCDGGGVGPITPDEVFDPEQYVFNPDGTLSLTTTADGTYQFFWRSPPVTRMCTYSLQVQPPQGFVAPSKVLPAQSGVFSQCGAVVPENAPPPSGSAAVYYLQFRSGPLGPTGPACEVIHNHVPLDPVAPGTLVLLKKEAPTRTVELGEFVDYKLTVTNHSGHDVTGLSVHDQLPPGLALIRGSVRLNGAKVADPAGAPGPTLNFSAADLTLADGATAVWQYRVRVGVGAPTNGEITNVAQAKLGLFYSNEARWRLRVRGGSLSDDAFIVGKVFLDCDGNQVQDGEQELGVPGVRLFMENGVGVVSDAHGRWSLFGVLPKTHVIRLDEATLPEGAQPTVANSRYMGQANSQFVDVRKGELARADFPITGCGAETVRELVAKRREAWKDRDGRAELEAAVRMTLDTSRNPYGDTRGIDQRNGAASGINSGSGLGIGVDPTPAQDRPLIQLPEGAANLVGALQPGVMPGTPGMVPAVPMNPDATTRLPVGEPAPLGPLPAVGAVPLEHLVVGLDGSLGFLDLHDGDTVAARDLNIRVKGPFGGSLRLSVNGTEQAERRIGKRVTLESRGIIAWEYIGIALEPGSNQLELQALDSAGSVTGTVGLRITAPDDLGRFSLSVPDGARADPMQPIAVTVRLTDKNGVPVTARTQVTLFAERGDWLDSDPNTSEPGLQAMVSGGSATFSLRPPSEPGPVRLQVSSGPIIGRTDVVLLPAQQRLIGVGIVEGVLDLSRRGKLQLGQSAAGAAFEQELGEVAAGDDGRLGARAALYLKGTIRGDMLLTAAFDSDKRQDDRLFRDIRANEYYPVYGDDSARTFDAQSSGKLYVRIDANRSYLLLGDFTTASSPEVRQISQVNRTLSGIKHKYEDEQLRVTSYVSHDSVTQQVVELPASGLSFYTVPAQGEIVANTESVELLVRSRLQPALVLRSQPLARGADYTFEPLTRRLFLVNPVPSLDGDLNPQSIRVSYEVDGGGEKFVVAGVDAQVKVTDNVQLGLVGATDRNPAGARDLVAATGLARLGDAAVLRMEAAQTHSDLKGTGRAAQAELTYQEGAARVHGKVQHSGANFDNPSANAAPGRTEANLTGELALSDSTKLRAEASYSESHLPAGGDRRDNVSLAVQHRVNESVAVELGVSHGNMDPTTAGRFDYGQVSGGTPTVPGAGNIIGQANSSTDTTVRGRVTGRLPDVPQAEVFAEAERAVGSEDRYAVAIGGAYALTERTRVYGRHELLHRNELNDDDEHRASTVVGLDAAYMEGGRVYNETRWNPSAAGTNATGLRHSIRLNDAWTVSGGLEHTRALGHRSGAGAVGSSTAWTVAADYAQDGLRGYTNVEWRQGDDSRSRLFNYGLAYRVDTDWTLIARGLATRNEAGQGISQTLIRQQLGMAWRPARSSQADALFKYENRYEQRAEGSAVPGADSAATAYRSHILSTVGNYRPVAGQTVTGRYALRYTHSDDAVSGSSYWTQLLGGRYLVDLVQDWDVGVQAGVLLGQGGAQQRTLGLEVGRQIVPNLWMSVGYNVLGLSEPDMTGADYTSQGVYLRLRFKFDEQHLDWLSERRATQREHAPDGIRERTAAARASQRPVEPAAAPAQPCWKPGVALSTVTSLQAEDLFGPHPEATALSSEGAAVLEEIAATVRRDELGAVDIRAGAGETDPERAPLWLARAQAVRAALSSLGPRDIGLAVDTRPAAADPRPAAATKVLRLQLLAPETPPAAPPGPVSAATTPVTP